MPPRPLLALSLLALAAALAVDAGRPPPRVIPASAPDTVFSAERAMRHIHAIAQRPRPPGSAEHGRVRSYLLNEIATLGLEPQVQETTAFSRGGGVAGRIFNILARLPGSSAGSRAVLLAAHYDGVGAGPAASDDAAGVAVLLETLRALHAGPPLAHDVIVLITDAEEVGLVGAGAFVRGHPWARDVEIILNFEARGTRGRSIMFESSSGDLDIVRTLRGFGDVEASSLWKPIYRALPNDTDMSRLADLAKPALNFAFVDGVERYHTTQDDPEHLDRRSLQHHGSQARYLAASFARGPLPRPPTGEAVFFGIPGVGLVVHPQEWNLGFGLMLVGVVLLALFLIAREERHWLRHLAIGAAGTVLAGILAAAVALLLILIAPEDVGAVGWRGAYATAITLASLAAASAVWIAARRWAGPAGAHLGAVVVWTALALLAISMAPGASFLFLWPALGAAVAAIARAVMPGSRAALLSSGAAVLVGMSLMVPALYLVGVVGLRVLEAGGVIIAFFAAQLAWLLAPQLDFLVGARRRTLPVAAMGAALGIVVVGAVIPHPPEAVPTKSVLAYALDADRGEGWMVSPAFLAESGSWAGEALAMRGPPGSITEEPPAWAARSFGYPRRMRAARVSAYPAPGAELEILSDSSHSAGRSLKMRLLAPDETLLLDIRLAGAPILRVSVDGQEPPFFGVGARSLWSLGYAAPPAEGVLLEVTLGPGAPVLELMTRSSGLPAPLARLIPARPIDVVPGLTGDVTVVWRSIRF